MAAINSHRRRQVYSSEIGHRGYHHSTNTAPSAAVVMMPNKNTSGSPYYASLRRFGALDSKLRSSYVGRTMRQDSKVVPSTGRREYFDRILTNPAGMDNPYDLDSYMSYAFRQYRVGGTNPVHPPIYVTDASAAGGLIGYNRSKTGLISGGYESYKNVRSGGATRHMKVVSVGDHIGGNIKSRQTTLKWIGGIWREKK